VLLVDTSVWVDYLRGVDTLATHELRNRLRGGVSDLATTEPIIMEILAGAKDERGLRQLEILTNGLVLLPVNAHRDYHDAAALYRAARRRGRTIRKLIDCLIGAVAVRNEATLLHNDDDFDAIELVAPLRARRPRNPEVAG
jgi:hypothetical protein